MSVADEVAHAARIAVVLADMHAVRSDRLGDGRPVVDDQRHAARAQQREQRFGLAGEVGSSEACLSRN